MKLKKLAAAVLLAAAAPAFANLIAPNSGNSELIFVIRDDTEGVKVSYTLDLGVTMDSFLAVAQQAGGYSQTWAISDANFASFVGQTNASAYEWAVQAGDSTGSGAGALRWLTTVKEGTDPSTIAMTNSNLANGVGTTILGGYYGAVGQTGTHSTQTNGSSVNNILDLGTSYYGETASAGPTLNDLALFTNTNAVGTSATFYSLIRSGGGAGNPAVVDQFDNAQNAGTWSLVANGANNYSLSYTLGAEAVAAVPEPGGLAMLLAGFTAMGFVGRRRSRR